jgi:hypothetical protein
VAGVAAARTVLAAAAGGPSLPGPGPFGAREWAGAAIYAALFLLAAWGAWRLVRSVPDGSGAP